MNGTRKRRLSALLIVLIALTLCFIWGNSLLDREESAEISGGLMQWITELGIPMEDDLPLRKLAHFVEFGLLGCELALLIRLRRGLDRSGVILAACAAFFAAAADETIQHFSGRSAEVSDVLLDLSGALTGILLIACLIFRKRKRTGTT